MDTAAPAAALVGAAPAHPLDPLSGPEMAAARAILMAYKALPDSTRFATRSRTSR